jgi:hypothetical protein
VERLADQVALEQHQRVRSQQAGIGPPGASRGMLGVRNRSRHLFFSFPPTACGTA